MNDVDLSVLFSLVFGLVQLGGYSILTVLQAIEVRRPKMWLSGFRWRLFFIFLLAVITLVPSLVYLLLRLLHVEAEGLRTIVTVTARVNSLATLILILSLYRFKKKE